MTNLTRTGLALGLLWTLALPAHADDIELFAAPNVEASGVPNVLFVFDTRASNASDVKSLRCSITEGGIVKTDGTGTAHTYLDGSSAGVAQCALYSALQALDVPQSGETEAEKKTFNIGIMGFNETNLKSYDPIQNKTSTVCPGNTGGCLLMPMVEFNSTTKPRILNWIRSWSKSAKEGHAIYTNNAASGATMQEGWAYFYGKTGISGRSYAGVSPDFSVCGAGNYVIFVGSVYNINASGGDLTNISNSPAKALEGASDSGKNADPVATQLEKTLYSGSVSSQCGTGKISLANTYEKDGFYALNWANYMKRQGITTYSVGILNPESKCDATYAAQLITLGQADVGGGKFFGTNDYEGLRIAFGTIFSEILSINSSFASVSLPVSVNTQGTFLNQVYIGMFRPDRDFLPRWPGNLKQYRMAYINNLLRLVDASEPPQSAISSSGTGFIAECARSYWTPSSDDSYWGTRFANANCVGHPANSNFPDGNIVEKGGQGYMLRGMTPANRVVKTCDASCGSTLADFNASNNAVSAAKLGTTDADRTALINWARGLNNKGDETIVAADKMRPSAHGSVVHSRPVTINFASGEDADLESDRELVVFYGGNDGMLRAVNANRDGGKSVGGAEPGEEIWSFVAPESYRIFSRLRDNTLAITYPGAAAAAKPLSYGFDGAVTAFKNGSNVSVFATMRRGGRMVYAFNVTDPGNPTLKWRIGCSDTVNVDGTFTAGTCTNAGFNDIGQTWSAPQAALTAGYTGPVLLMGGGYDTCEDFEGSGKNNNCGSTPRGRFIYVIDAATGALLKTFTTTRSVVGEVTLVKDSGGLARYAYAADLGGNVYRIDIGDAAPSAWTMTKIAMLGCDDGGTGCDANRKFMFAPDVVNEKGTHYVMLGSGDREKPLSSYEVTGGVQNYFFVLKDKPASPDWLNDECGEDNNYLCLESLLNVVEDEPSESEFSTGRGWMLALRDTEQVVTSAVTVFGTVTFSTHIPFVAPDTPPTTVAECKPGLGTASVYNVRYINAESANGTNQLFEEIKGGGLPPSPVAGKVELDDGTVVPFIIGASPESPLESKSPEAAASSVSQPNVRVYRYIQK